MHIYYNITNQILYFAGKISRVLAAKTALAIRVDALGDGEGPSISIDSRMKVEARIRQLEGGQKVTNATNGSSVKVFYLK